VSDAFTLQAVQVKLDIRHTYIGDLVVKIEHGGAEETLFNREGGSDFEGLETQGDWVLTVSDHAAADTGTLNSWSIKIVPAQ
jgi:subtilisin-like proprotein convertase family protein